MPNKIILYSNHCPLCKGLQKALDSHNIAYEICTDINIMQQMGITRTPMLLVDDTLMSNQKALRWVISQENNEN